VTGETHKREILHWGKETVNILNNFNWEEITFDTETTDLKQDRLEITGMSLCNKTENYYVPIPEDTRLEIMEYFGQVFKKVNRLIGHNLVFDLRVLAKYGIEINPKTTKLFCTMVAHHLIDENSKHSLKYLTRELLGREVQDYDEKLSHYCDEFYQYALDDSYNTWLLYEKFLPELLEQDLQNLFFKIEMPWQFILLQMHLEGVLINTKMLRKQQTDLRAKILELEIKLHDFLGLKYMMQHDLIEGASIVTKHNFNSPQQIVELFKQQGIEITEKTPTGNPSVGKATLYANLKNPFVHLLMRYRTASKLYNSFISPTGQIERNLESDGKIRTNFRDTGTVTGRLSANNPNFQQLSNPKCLECLGGDFTNGVCDDCSTVYEFNVRSTLKAPDGYVMFSADYSGQEVYSMAHLCKDPTLIKMLEMGQDQHFVNAKAVFKLDIPDEYLVKSHPKFKEVKAKYGSYRKKGKIFSFGVPYGMGAHKAMRDFNITEKEAEEMINNLWSSFPKLKEAIDETHKEADRTFQVKSLVGRVRHFGKDYSKVKLKNKNLGSYKPEIVTLMKQGAGHRQSFNFKIQGLCADMVRMAGVNVFKKTKEEWGLKPVLTIHDEIVYLVKKEHFEEASKCVKKNFEYVTKNLVVPIPVDIEMGDDYGTAK
jgi:DNA polymerase I